jgi:hypothetical protein
MDDNFLMVEEAMEIVYSLASQNALDEKDADTPELLAECRRQQTALKVVWDFIANNMEEREELHIIVQSWGGVPIEVHSIYETLEHAQHELFKIKLGVLRLPEIFKDESMVEHMWRAREENGLDQEEYEILSWYKEKANERGAV